MKADRKKNLLTNTAKVIEKAAIFGGGYPTWLGFHEPKKQKVKILLMRYAKV